MCITGADRQDISDIKKVCLENLDKKYHSQFLLKRIMNGYRRSDPTRGMEYILDLLLADRLHPGVETIKRVHLVRPLGKIELVPMPYVTENMMITVILPLQPDDIAVFDMFMDSYARTCLQSMEDVRLIVALMYPVSKSNSTNPRDPFARSKASINDYTKRYITKGKLSWKALDNVLSDITVVDRLQGEFKIDALILMTTVNMEMSPDLTNNYFNRVRMNTIKGKQVFFPMGFWQYRPNLMYNKKPFPASVEIGQRLGQYSTRSAEHASFYLSDYRTARKVLSTKTVDIFSMFVTYKNFHVFRAVEPNLKLKWMNLTCDPRVAAEKYQQCITRNIEGLASQHHLALLIYEQRNEVISQSNIYKAKIIPERNDPVQVVPQDSGIIHPPEPTVLKPEDVELKLHEENVRPPPADPQAEGMILVHPKKNV